MRSSLTLGRFFGIPVGVNWSWLVVFALIVYTLYDNLFPESNPGHSNGTYAAMALVAAVLFFTSLLLHEFGHALVARREGMEIDGITLWLFGGVARFKGMFPSAGAEFRIAIAGPLVSLALGVVFVLLAVGVPLPDVADGVAAYLGYINLALLAFNLLPALPLDGGRVLRSALWQVKGDLGWATRVAAWIGRAFGYLLIAGGIAMVIFEDGLSGVWLALIGWFLLQAAGAEANYGRAQRTLAGLHVRDVMASDPATVDPSATLAELANGVVATRPQAAYPVVEGSRAVGLLSLRDVAAVPRGEWGVRTVRDTMVPLDGTTVFAPGDELIDAAATLSEDDLQDGLVLDDGRLAGLLSIADVARAFELRR
jgi:Zn-dependent protease/CBS domain-containing protein